MDTSSFNASKPKRPVRGSQIQVRSTRLCNYWRTWASQEALPAARRRRLTGHGCGTMTGVERLHGEGEYDKRQWEFLLATYEDRQRMIGASEELGERRLQMYLTVVAAGGVAVGLVSDSTNQRATLAAGAAASVLLVVLGLSTTIRVAKRDCATSWLKNDLLKLRCYVADGTALAEALPHMNDKEPWKRRRAWHPTRGGLVDLLGVLTSTFAGLSVFAGWTAGAEPDGLALWPPVVTALAVTSTLWFVIVAMVRQLYDKEGCLDGSTRSATFRASVGLVVRRHDGMVLICRRVKEQSWQFPQGGIKPGEHPETAGSAGIG